MALSTILVVDSDSFFRKSLVSALTVAGHQVLEATNRKIALELCEDEGVDLALIDCSEPTSSDAIGMLKDFKNVASDLVVIVMTTSASVEQAVVVMKQGAFHYARKPFVLDEMIVFVEKGLETTRLVREMKLLHANVSAPYSFDRIIGESPVMKEVKELMRKVATSPVSTVLLYGESGTGKDRAAKTIHFNSARSQRLFMNITCSALPETLLESELFGHERGAFTDAKKQKKGLLELAQGGTVFLDEISEMPPALQAKLLRFLEEKSFKRLGGTSDIQVDVRVIAATNRNLDEAIHEGLLRRDLYYRLQVLPIRLPPLRERIGDIPLLANFFIDNFNREFRKKIVGISSEAVAILESHTWEGNIREFRNAFERAMLFHEKEILTSKDFPLLVPLGLSIEASEFPVNGVNLDEITKNLVTKAWELAKGNQTRAATLLGITRDRIRYQVEKLGLKYPA